MNLIENGYCIEASNGRKTLVSVKDSESLLPRYFYINANKEFISERFKERNYKELNHKLYKTFTLRDEDDIKFSKKNQYNKKLIRAEDNRSNKKDVKEFISIEDDLFFNDEWARNIDIYLNQLKSLGTFKFFSKQINKETIYTPEILIVEEFNASIKIPYYLIDNDNNKVWDFDYILYPLNAFRGDLIWNKELIDYISDTFNISFDFNKEENKIPEITNGFSVNWYEYYNEELVCATIKTRAIINIIRDLGFYYNSEDNYYAIYQESRMAKTDKMDYIKINYKSPIVEKTFNQVLSETLNTSKLKLNELILNIDYENLKEFIKEVDKNLINIKNDKLLYSSFEAVKLYIENVQETSSTLFRLYKKLEQEREYIKRKILYMNLLLVVNNESVDDILTYFFKNSKQGISRYEYKMGDRNQYVMVLEMLMKKINIKEVDLVDKSYVVENKINKGNDLHDLDWSELS